MLVIAALPVVIQRDRREKAGFGLCPSHPSMTKPSATKTCD